VVVLFVLIAFAWSFQGEIRIPESSIAVQDSIEIALVIEDLQLIEPPKLKVGLGLEIRFQNQSHISEIASRNGKSQRIDVYTYTYQIRAKEIGIWYITAPILQYGGKQLSIDSKSIEVHSSVQRDTSEVILKGILRNETPYEGEIVAYDIKYSKRISFVQDEIDYPNLQGFQEIIPTQSLTKNFRSEIDGYIYNHHNQRLFFQALASTAYSVSPTRVKIKMSSHRRGTSPLLQFLGMSSIKEENYASQAYRGLIRPLPSPPSDFSGLVGQFFLMHIADRPVAKVGESVQITTKIYGSGVISDQFQFPDIESNNFRVYSERPQRNKQIIKDQYQETYATVNSIIPLDGGNIKIPAILMTVFNPQSRKYEQLYAPEIKLKITGKAEKIELSSYGSEKQEDFTPRHSSDAFFVQKIPIYVWLLPLCIAPFFRNRSNPSSKENSEPNNRPPISGTEEERIKKWIHWLEEHSKEKYHLSVVTFEKIYDHNPTLAAFYEKMMFIRYSNGNLHEIESELVNYKLQQEKRLQEGDDSPIEGLR